MTETKTKTVKKEAEKATTTDVQVEAGKTTKDAEKPVQPRQGGAEKATHAIDEVFGKLKAHFEAKKVDEWQKKWLAMPANRKKYAKLADAPEVVGEELVAVTNDIIDFIQGQEGGQSHIFKRVKDSFHTFFRHPVQAAQKEVGKTTEAAKETTEKGATKAKETALAHPTGVEKAKTVAEKTTKSVVKTAKK